jgi:hypothetical protein
MDAKTYHAHSALSHSQLEDFIRDPALYYGRHVSKPRLIPYEGDTLSTSVGTGYHSATLEGEEAFYNTVAIWKGGKTKDGKDTTNRNSAAYKEWKAANGDRVELEQEDCDVIAAMLEATRQHTDASQLLWGCDGINEHSAFWQEREELAARLRFDRVIPSHDIIVDLKSAYDISNKARQKAIHNYGYHRKAEWYRRGYVANYGRPLREFLFIWVSTDPRATHLNRVVVSRLDPMAEAQAQVEIDRALDDLEKRRKSGDWRPDHCVDVQTDGLPLYAIDRDALKEAV